MNSALAQGRVTGVVDSAAGAEADTALHDSVPLRPGVPTADHGTLRGRLLGTIAPGDARAVGVTFTVPALPIELIFLHYVVLRVPQSDTLDAVCCLIMST